MAFRMALDHHYFNASIHLFRASSLVTGQFVLMPHVIHLSLIVSQTREAV